jgi:hypothetical protein
MSRMCEECAHEVRNSIVILRKVLNPYFKSETINILDRDLIRIFFSKIEKQVMDKANDS